MTAFLLISLLLLSAVFLFVSVLDITPAELFSGDYEPLEVPFDPQRITALNIMRKDLETILAE